MKKRIRIKTAMMTLIFLSIFFLLGARAEAKLPEIITMTSWVEGTAAYAWTAGFRKAIEKFSPMQVRVEPYGEDLGRLLPLKTGDSELACVGSSSAYIFGNGLWDWKKFGPQPIQLVWSGWRFQTGLATKANSGIMTLADLKGKKVPYLPGVMAVSKNIEAHLAFAGLTWKDVKQVKVSSMRAQVGGILKGSHDVCLSVPFAPPIQALASGPYGLRWLEMPKEDSEGWKRAKAVAPWVGPDLVTAGPGLSKESPRQMIGFPNGLWAYGSQSEELVYAVAKALHLGYDTIKGMHPDLKKWTIDTALEIEWLINIPYHPGSIRYFKEIGRWTPAHEKWQQEALKIEKKRLGQ
ncbi:TAXI family TRAP transporter solute-binding subunit [Thermodesulfobacteriota bacterium]